MGTRRGGKSSSKAVGLGTLVVMVALLVGFIPTAQAQRSPAFYSPIISEVASTGSVVADAPGAQQPTGQVVTEESDASQMVTDVVQTEPEAAVYPELPFSLTPLEESSAWALNQERQFAGLHTLAVAEDLTQVARMRAADMATLGYFSHTAPDGTTAIGLLNANGIPYVIAGEILGRTNASEQQMVPLIISAFMRSPSHRPWVVYHAVNEMGVGVAFGERGMKYLAIILAQR